MSRIDLHAGPAVGFDQPFDMLEACQAPLHQAGFEHYEVSAYARPGRRGLAAG